MNTRAMLRFAHDAVTECQAGNITAPALCNILGFFRSNAASVRALPGADNAQLRLIGARMEGWLRSIQQPETVDSPALLLARLQQITQSVRELALLEDARDLAIPEVPSNVIPFPLDRPAALRAGMTL